MYALSIWQPFASLIGASLKQYETRSWHPARSLLGRPLCIHAAKSRKGLAAATNDPRLARLVRQLPEPLPFGAIIAIARLDHVHGTQLYRDRVSADEQACGDWRDSRFAWRLDQVRPLRNPIQCSGAQGLWIVPERLAAMAWNDGMRQLRGTRTLGPGVGP